MAMWVRSGSFVTRKNMLVEDGGQAALESRHGQSHEKLTPFVVGEEVQPRHNETTIGDVEETIHITVGINHKRRRTQRT